jgi:hypothetical protein
LLNFDLIPKRRIVTSEIKNQQPSIVNQTASALFPGSAVPFSKRLISTKSHPCHH